MAGSFSRRVEVLADMVGDGDLVGTFAVNGGPRTVPLHEAVWRTGPNAGVRIRNYNEGGPKFVEGPLKERHRAHLRAIAETALKTGPQEGMVGFVRDMNEQLGVRAPIEEGDLRQSGNEFVTDGGELIHHEPQRAEPK